MKSKKIYKSIKDSSMKKPSTKAIKMVAKAQKGTVKKVKRPNSSSSANAYDRAGFNSKFGTSF